MIIKKVRENLIKYVDFKRRPVAVMTVNKCNSHRDLTILSTKIPKVRRGRGRGSTCELSL